MRILSKVLMMTGVIISGTGITHAATLSGEQTASVMVNVEKMTGLANTLEATSTMGAGDIPNGTVLAEGAVTSISGEPLHYEVDFTLVGLPPASGGVLNGRPAHMVKVFGHNPDNYLFVTIDSDDVSAEKAFRLSGTVINAEHAAASARYRIVTNTWNGYGNSQRVPADTYVIHTSAQSWTE
ncbi:TPA: hypothetical protein U2R15_004163 [Klebsiella aerogenes]|nr:hypothetical protein [Klebsiella aerogenes]